MSSIDDFLQTGQLGPIQLGLTPESVRELLGEPDDVSARQEPRIWKYGPLQLTFAAPEGSREQRLGLIGLYFWDADSVIPAALGLKGWIPSGQTDFDSFLDHVEQTFGTASVRHDGSKDYLRFASGVTASFDDGLLQKILCAPRPDRKRRQWTVSLSLTTEQYEEIQRELAARRISASTLFLELIQKHLSEASKIGSPS